MASIRKEILIAAPIERVWSALRDVSALHSRLAPGFVVDTRMDGNARIVKFGNGMEAREDIVSVDDAHRRVCWAIVGAQFRHYNGSAQVTEDINGTRFVWTTDLLPDDFAAGVAGMMEAGIAVIKETMEAARDSRLPPTSPSRESADGV